MKSYIASEKIPKFRDIAMVKVFVCRKARRH